MENEEAHWEEEQNFHKVFYNMAKKVDKLFSEYEKELGHGKEVVNDNRSSNHEGGGEEPPPSPYSSDNSSSYHSSFHHSNMHKRNASKNRFLKLDVKFDLPIFSGDSNAEKLDN